MFLYLLQDTSGFGHHGQIGRIERPYLIHALQTQDHLLACVVWDGAHGQASVATLRHDADLGFDASFHNI